MALPPGPTQPPAAQTLAWVARPVPFMRRCRREYGDIFTVRLARIGTFVFISDPAEIKRIFTGDPEKLRAGRAAAPLEPVMGRNSLLLLDEPEHMRQRKLLLPPFHGERMHRYRELIAEVTDDALDRWPLRRPFALQPEMQAITLEVILRAVFGLDDPALRDRVSRALLRLLAVGTGPAGMLPWLRRDLGPGSPWRRFMAARAHADGLLYAEIARRRDDPDLERREDILSLMLLARDEDGAPMSDREVRDELMTLLLAGHETTATSLAWAFERLFRRPDALERLERESRDGDDDSYADAVVKETLRLRPVIPLVAREPAAPYAIGPWTVEAPARLAPCIYLTHRRPDVYPEPDAFRPERFLDRPPDTYAWLPFGGGVRRCLGASFASFEMKVVLRTLLSRARLRPAASEWEPTRRRAIVFTPARGGEAVLEERLARRAPASERLAA